MRRAFSLFAWLTLCVLLGLPGTSAAQSADAADTLPPAAEASPGAALDMHSLGDDSLAQDLQPTDVAAAGLATYVDGVVSALQREHGLAALTVSVVKDDALLLARVYGSTDLAGARPAEAGESLFRIGSISKTFTWTAVMMLVDRGLIDLDEDLNTYLRQVKIDEAYGQPVTMRQLMHHRAGFEDSMRLFAVADDDPRPLAELLMAHQPRRVFPPGARTSYSNWGAALAAQVVEDASGVPYAQFVQREILDPLGMRDTTWIAPSRLDAGARAKLATGYRKQGGALAVQGYMQIGAYWPAGGIASSATDMARWMRLHLNGGELEGVRLLRPEAHAQLWTRAYGDRPAAADVAHGFQDRYHHGLRLIGHGGGTAAFLSNMILVPELGLGVFVSQSSTHTRAPIGHLPELVIDRLRGRDFLPAPQAEAGDTGALSGLAGTYLNNRRAFTSFAAVLGLSATASVTPIDADTLLLGQQGEARQYRRVGSEPDTFEAADGQRIAFLRDGSNVVAMADGSGVHTLEKLRPWQTPQAFYAALALASLLSISSLLGFWWRMGRRSRPGFASIVASGICLLSALATLLFLAITAVMVQQLSGFDLSTMPGNYPSAAMLQVHYAGWVLAGCGGLMLFGLWPVWSGSGWGPWRRLHFSLYALVLAALAALLWQWRVIGAPVW